MTQNNAKVVKCMALTPELRKKALIFVGKQTSLTFNI